MYSFSLRGVNIYKLVMDMDYFIQEMIYVIFMFHYLIQNSNLEYELKYIQERIKKDFCNLSVTVACQPKDITKLKQSKYSLDDKDKIPLSLIYKS